MIRFTFLPLLIVLLLSSCTEPPLVRRTREPAASVPYRLELDFSSALPDPFYLFAGPMETYNRYPVNGALKRLLTETLDRQQGAAGSLQAVVAFRLLALIPRFDQYGLLNFPVSRTVMVFEEKAFFLQRAEMDGGGDGGIDLPLEVHRGATLIGELRIRVEGREIHRQTLEIVVREVIYRDDDDRSKYLYSDRFDFGPVLERVLLKSAAEVSRIVALTLGTRS
ncbi:hypothetical protein C2E25_00670 [Geothermobacter hydrogeniphilus]|uniref:Lipoprotein n=1 Tax=Geothermobacter hydrogeniphilus TaxID=1969733 RepID=A0A2K2HEQ5_9BACT|nr:hypothetical protein [Geothermobacter hydrogeniphilus]PNU21775.1 hypothetical protein C2E25_00670 [Geothermobacter hydrogeniphilus]